MKTNQEEWEKEFDELSEPWFNFPDHIKKKITEFIRNLLTSEREKAYQEITEDEAKKDGFIKFVQQHTKQELIKEIEEFMEIELAEAKKGVLINTGRVEMIEDTFKYLNTLK